MTASDRIETARSELRALATGLPFKVIVLPEFRRSGFEPERVRQDRTFPSPDDRAQPISRFLVERGVVPLLAPAQTMALFREIHWCGYRLEVLARRRLENEAAATAALAEGRRLLSRIEAAEEELFIANRRLVVSCVKPYFWVGPVWMSDFLQEGSKALANAVRKFDYRRGTPFYSYSQAAITNRLRNFFRDHARLGSFGVKPSRDMQAVKNAIETWQRDHGCDPTDDIVAKLTDLTPERVAKVRQYVAQWDRMPQTTVSLDAEVGQDGTELYELVEDPGADRAAALTEFSEIWDLVGQLPERTQAVVRLRFIEGRTLEESGRLLHLTRARIKQIQDAAVQKIRQALSLPGRHG